MSRSEKRRKVGMIGILIGLVISAGAVVAFFSLMAHQTLQGEWPLGIETSEVQRYAEVADLRRIETQMREPQGEPFYFGASQEGHECLQERRAGAWETRWFEAQGYGDSVQVRAITDIAGGFELRFKDEAPFRGQHGILISPADAGHMRMKYAEILAKELGLATPAIGFVRVVSCGRELPVHVVEEVIGEGFLAHRRYSEAVLFKRSFDPDRPDQLFPEVIGDTTQGPLLRSMLTLLQEDAARDRLDKMSHTLDDQAAAAWLLMHWLEGAPDPLYQENAFAFHWNRGRFTPLHRPTRLAPDPTNSNEKPWSVNVFTPWLKVPAFKETMAAKRNELIGKRDALEKAFAAADSTWLPVLANDAPGAEVAAIADQVKTDIFGRLQEGDPIAFLDRPLTTVPGSATLMQGQEMAKRYWPSESDVDGVQTIVKKYRARLDGDSIVFPRGKYSIDEDLIIPKGYALILLSGARITMAAGRSILCQGPLFVRGSKLNPVFIRPGGGAYGTLAVLGDGDTPCSIIGLQMSGGSGARINGVMHPAMLSIQDVASSRFANCIISAPASEVALFVQGGTFDMDDCTMFNSRVDVRDVVGGVRSSFFQGGARGNAGLSVNASRMNIASSGFRAINGTAIEANDGSRAVVRGTTITGCGTAIAASDLAEVHVLENTISGNRTAFSAKRNKPLYGGAKIFVHANDLQRNGTERSADEHSSISDAERFDERVLDEVVEH